MFIFVPSSKLYSLLNSAVGMGKGRGLCKTIYLCLYLPLMCFPCSGVGFPRAAVFQEKTCSSTAPPWPAGDSLLQWHPSSPSFSGLGMCRTVAHYVFPSSAACLSLLCFLKHTFPKVPPLWLRGSAVSCHVSVRDSSVWHGAAHGHFSQRPPRHHHHHLDTYTQYRYTADELLVCSLPKYSV